MKSVRWMSKSIESKETRMLLTVATKIYKKNSICIGKRTQNTTRRESRSRKRPREEFQQMLKLTDSA